MYNIYIYIYVYVIHTYTHTHIHININTDMNVVVVQNCVSYISTLYYVYPHYSQLEKENCSWHLEKMTWIQVCAEAIKREPDLGGRLLELEI